MELSQLGFLEELLAPRKDTWSALSTTAFSDMLFPASSSSSCWNFDPFVDNPSLASSSPSSSFVAAFSTTATTDQRFECPFTTPEPASYPFAASDDGFTMPDLDSSYPLTQQNEDHLHHNPSSLEDNNNEDGVFLGSDDKLGLLLEERTIGCCKVEEQGMVDVDVPVVFNMGPCGAEKKPKPKKIEGQPSKNLMAERRRRKRLNDRLSMLRSIVPKISKMDRTSILGDTIDYMKELLERISKLQEEEEEVEDGRNHINLLGISKELKPNEVMVRNSPKFDVERRDQDTRISICCATKPGLLLSTVNTLEALGLEIQQCVISSFNDFSMQASCSEVAEQRNCINPEEIKQALFRNAGYGGRCL